ncbi:hypothetical protein ISF6_3451 [Piscinibacter sakaiensis]|uniref:Uncharacterized protein n=1 Tax=Piscinibacter sakaiensis TaxID=1547922 RepID=A0A0K8NVR2_PISS1|nr:hypothetical protein ISF6_3451 [Piscinibacter sakaiensis]
MRVVVFVPRPVHMSLVAPVIMVRVVVCARGGAMDVPVVAVVRFHVHVSGVPVRRAARVRAVVAMVTVAPVSVKQMHHRAGQQQEVRPVAGDVPPVLAQLEEGGDQRRHRRGNPKGPRRAGGLRGGGWGMEMVGRHGGLLVGTGWFNLAVAPGSCLQS